MTDCTASTSSEISNSASSSHDRAEALSPGQIEPPIKYEWYQTNTHVTVALLVKHVKTDKTQMQFFQQSFTALIETEQGQLKRLDINLAHKVIPAQCTFRVLTQKVEIKLCKHYPDKWSSLEPTSGLDPKTLKPINWDKVVETELKDDKPESESALNEVFQKIYSQGSDEVKKAMNKSFLESGGTVLSTNWNQVGRGTVKIKPPDGLEWKKWD